MNVMNIAVAKIYQNLLNNDERVIFFTGLYSTFTQQPIYSIYKTVRV